MAQIKFLVAENDTLKERLERGARSLGVASSALAKLVVDEFLETYVEVAVEAETRKQRTFDEIRSEFRRRAIALGARQFEEPTELAALNDAIQTGLPPSRRVRETRAARPTAS
jgi:hypothetical protein